MQEASKFRKKTSPIIKFVVPFQNLKILPSASFNPSVLFVCSFRWCSVTHGHSELKNSSVSQTIRCNPQNEMAVSEPENAILFLFQPLGFARLPFSLGIPLCTTLRSRKIPAFRTRSLPTLKMEMPYQTPQMQFNSAFKIGTLRVCCPILGFVVC